MQRHWAERHRPSHAGQKEFSPPFHRSRPSALLSALIAQSDFLSQEECPRRVIRAMNFRMAVGTPFVEDKPAVRRPQNSGAVVDEAMAFLTKLRGLHFQQSHLR